MINNSQGKFDTLVLMLRKLYAFASGSCAVDNQDAQTNQELLTGGLLYGNYLKVIILIVHNNANKTVGCTIVIYSECDLFRIHTRLLPHRSN